MILRRELPRDVAAIHRVHAAAFGRESEAALVVDLRADGDVVPELSLVAMDEAEVVGHVLGSPATLAGSPLLALGPLGVLPAYQRRGVGLALVHALVAAADALNAPAVVLLGDPRYYSRFGFVLAAPLGIVAPDPRWAAHLQVRTLHAWDGSLRGAFRYAPAFR